MKICLFNVTSTMDVIGSGEVGGVEAYTFRLGLALKQRGHDVILFGGSPKNGRSFYESTLKVKLFPYLETSGIPNLGTRFRRLAQRLHFARSARSEFLAEQFDVALIFKPYDLITARNWRRAGWKNRVIASIHGPEFYALDRCFVSSVDAMYAASHSTAGAVEKHYGKPCAVIPNFLDVNKFRFLTRPDPPPEKLIVTAGRLVGWKGLASLIRAFVEIHSRMPEAHLVVIGDGPEKVPLERLTWQLGLASAVQFPGVLSEESVRSFHQKAWIFVQPSIGYESFSISALEALASGLTVLVSDQVGVADWFCAGENIEMFPAGDEDKLKDSIHRLLNEPWTAHRERGRRARSIVETEFADEKVISRIERLCLGKEITASSDP